MAQTNYIISSTELSLTASGTTVASGNTKSASFVLVHTMVRTGITSGELASGSLTWSIDYVVSALLTPYELYFVLQRNNSAGTAQATSNAGTTRTADGTYTDNITWDSGTWAANDQLALLWYHRVSSGTANKSASINANGSSYVTAPTPSAPIEVLPSVGELTFTGYAPTVSIEAVGSSFEATPGVGELTFTGYAPIITITSFPRYLVDRTGKFVTKGGFLIKLK